MHTIRDHIDQIERDIHANFDSSSNSDDYGFIDRRQHPRPRPRPKPKPAPGPRPSGSRAQGSSRHSGASRYDSSSDSDAEDSLDNCQRRQRSVREGVRSGNVDSTLRDQFNNTIYPSDSASQRPSRHASSSRHPSSNNSSQSSNRQFTQQSRRGPFVSSNGSSRQSSSSNRQQSTSSSRPRQDYHHTSSDGSQNIQISNGGPGMKSRMSGGNNAEVWINGQRVRYEQKWWRRTTAGKSWKTGRDEYAV